MGRGRAKGKKLSSTSQDDPGSGEEEKIPQQKRRGRPQKLLKEEMDEEEAQKNEDDDSENTLDGDVKSKSPLVGKKRARTAQTKDKAADSVKEENGNGTSTEDKESNKPNGFRTNGNRRKNKPHRAAEAVVECN
ncbi:uncharacterized protein LOC127244415 [Andrographis paniculata]|uniref:uncharacterized protein LOC127244415 n=1 Tax=Andrographis paniculata TaxID=175694 RepID=UPI0021E9941F|nr:uncharacterized protein LOC127244415 [Andrographis paniculata]